MVDFKNKGLIKLSAASIEEGQKAVKDILCY